MTHSVGILFLHLSSLVNPQSLSKVISCSLQKVERTLYVNIKGFPSETKVSVYNKFINQIYFTSSNNLVDTRVILANLRDALQCSKPSLNTTLKTSQTLDTFMALSMENINLDSLENKKDGCRNVVQLTIDASKLEEVELSTDPPPKIANHPYLADADKMYEHVVIGGTFDRLHSGHKMLISAAILRCKKSLTIGVTEGAMIQSKKLWEVIEPCQKRIAVLREFVMDIEPRLTYNIVPITDPYGPTAHVPTLELLVVSEETLKGGLKVNQLRQEKGLNLLDIHCISLIDDSQASDNEESKISSSSFRKRLLGTHIKPPKFKTKPYVIGLTGGIASGKTTICNRLKDMGAKIISCDRLGHAAYKKNTICYQEIVKYFGESVLNEDNEIDRKKLGPIVFSNKEHLDKLNSLVWPEIRRLYLEEINALKREHFQGIIVLEAAVLLEAGWDEDCAEVWVSIVPKDEAVRRIISRDQITAEQATRRIESQMSNSDRVAKANVVLCSVWEPQVTAAQVVKAWNSVQEFLV